MATWDQLTRPEISWRPAACPVERVACMICGGEDSRPELEAAEVHFGMGGIFQFVRCGGCGHVYLNPRPTPDAVGGYYPSTYYRGSAAQPLKPTRHRTGLRERLVRAALRQHFGYPVDAPVTPLRRLLTWPVARHLRRSRRHIDALSWAGAGELLDFGCGAGRFLRLQRDRGWKVSGIDFNAEVVGWAQEEDGIQAAAGTWPGEVWADRTWDVITSWHVIEHLPDPVGWLRQAARQTRPGGYVLVCCPNADSFGYRFFREFWNGTDAPRHLSLFTRAELRGLLADVGLEDIEHRPQARPATLRASAEIRAKQTGSAWWRFLSRRRWLWAAVARITALTGAADGMILIARKPIVSSGDR